MRKEKQRDVTVDEKRVVELEKMLAALNEDGMDKLAEVSKYLFGLGWVATSTKWMGPEDIGWFRGDILLILDEVGVLVYRVQGRAWERFGGIGYLSFKGLPYLRMNNSMYVLDLEQGKVSRVHRLIP